MESIYIYIYTQCFNAISQKTNYVPLSFAVIVL